MSLGEDLKFCYNCENPLSIFPIFVVQDSNECICGRWGCRKKILTNKNSFHSSTYEVLLKSQKFNCVNRHAGCMVKLNPHDMEKHEERCDYGPLMYEDVSRKLFPTQPEYWSVDFNFQSILQHIVTNSMTFEDAEALFEEDQVLSISKNLSSFCIITNNEREYYGVFSSLKVTGNNGLLFIKILNLNKNCDTIPFICYVIHGELNSTRIDISTTNVIPIVIPNSNTNSYRNSIPANDILLKFKIEVTRFQENNLRECDHQVVTFDENFLSSLKCPICLSYMTSKIFLCTTGHSFCETCHQEYKFCTVCKSNLEQQRNYTLESVLKHVTLPCKYAGIGCTFTAKLEELEEHYLYCTFAIQKCVLDDYLPCPWIGQFEKMVMHIENEHKNVVVESNTISINIYEGFYKSDFKSCHVLLPQKKMFLLHFLYENQIFYWAIQSFLQSCKFMLEIQILDETDRKQEMVFKKIIFSCPSYSVKQVKENACISIKLEEIKSFIKNSLSYNVRII